MKVIKFGATWCGPCKMYAPVFALVEKQISDHKFVAVDIDESPATGNKYSITTIPTTIYLDDNEVEIGRITGALSETQLVKFIEGED
tara:strand:- start:145 stop:405 length:261 start_codon:yes stop_codon:yes gene_type:complete